MCLTAFARRYHGLAPVAAEPSLMAAATDKVRDMVQCGYSHTACGKKFDYWIAASGFTGLCSAENIAQGQRTPRAVFEGWMKSPGHRANILQADYRYIGIGTGAAAKGQNWVMELGGC